MRCLLFFIFFFFNDTATTEIYTLSLHDALPRHGLEFGPRSCDWRHPPLDQLTRRVERGVVVARRDLNGSAPDDAEVEVRADARLRMVLDLLLDHVPQHLRVGVGARVHELR